MALDAVSAPRSYSQDDGGQPEMAGAKKNADYDMFIKLLVAQMKNQDPTKPMDSTEFVSQLASFSSVEQAIKMNETLSQMLSNGLINGAEGYVGKYIQFTDEKDKVIEGYVVSIDIYSDGIVATLDNGEKVVIGPGVKVMTEKPDVEGEKPGENGEKPEADGHKSYVGRF
ncbi:MULTISPECIES: flagellar hook assembly protein FlgD [Bartonella]|uniref:Basal-body rod modification protein FlgD n=1 Tax=Bartonella rochalimae ATCC BAA-1498 TaxID=685782 RepID=E6YL33_9HYPH|nr:MULTISPECIES: flagellar hook assembly protein FlgD [Bartonella]AQX18595.1 flagellar basal-body rod modification protein FlgD [Bartonella sp. A1379B]AQX23109.1 flagellar basal-body rod modification protein FlgD [Bartonella sp. 11B]AQX23592.1 flagellar basal-body rod modification protein FlgD [Bartonella sp. 114]AQX25564.1 flagellar basal-body rod modification protein FlgD [Bartonella sp. Coyote22sub2]AQX26861.1 flagellar basal-body rod modification protein FlgD [Bartonella sp. Raccoon60]